MKYVHTVFFTCKPEVSAAERKAQLDDAQWLLGAIPTVKFIRSGLRDTAMQREVSMTDFDIGLTVVFDNKAAYEVYADHPLHMDYIARHKKSWAGIKVCDFIAD